MSLQAYPNACVIANSMLKRRLAVAGLPPTRPLLNATQIELNSHSTFLLKAPACLLWLKNDQFLTQFNSTNIY